MEGEATRKQRREVVILAARYYEVSGASPTALLGAATGKEVRRFAGHWKQTTVLAFSRDGNALVSGSDDVTLIIWNLKSPKRK